MTLNELGKKHKTDKSGHGYLDTYEMYISRHRREWYKEVLEIGVRSGASLRMWAEYFPEAWIWGIDVAPECLKHDDRSRIHVIIGPQAERGTLDRIPDNLDLIIDDGSHVNLWTLGTFNLAFKKLRKGGIYIIEDLHCSYNDLEKTGARDKWFGMEHAPKMPRQDRLDIDYLVAKVAHEVDAGNIESMHVHKKFIVVVK